MNPKEKPEWQQTIQSQQVIIAMELSRLYALSYIHIHTELKFKSKKNIFTATAFMRHNKYNNLCATKFQYMTIYE